MKRESEDPGSWGLSFFRFRYVKGPVLHPWLASEILRAAALGLGSIKISLDLGLSLDNVRILGSRAVFGELEIELEKLSSLEEGFLYKLVDDELIRLDLFDKENYYKLKPVSPNKAPTLEINGIQMHRTVGTDPWSDAVDKVRALGRIRGLKILDVGTGLGYTASVSAARGAGLVVTIEKDPNVLFLASMNPWSKGLENPRILIVLEDAVKALPRIPDQSFDRIIHDPPRISVAEELYSADFYRELHRVLKPCGKILHYTGEPGKHAGVRHLKGIKKRLSASGFTKMVWIDEVKGFIISKC